MDCGLDRKVILTSWVGPAINVDVVENRSMTVWLLHGGAAQFTTAIARMLGKAVKVRHCPATVSASAPVPVVQGCRIKAEFQPGFSQH
jgi:hypothetical protein